MAGFVDVHAHFLTDAYVARARAAGHDVPDGMPGWPHWSLGEHSELMDRLGIDSAVLSLSSPGVHFGDDEAARVLAREVNEPAQTSCGTIRVGSAYSRPCRCRTSTAPSPRSATPSTA
jgi:hypothetical protein